MATYRIKKSLTIVPAIFLLLLSLFLVVSLKGDPESLLAIALLFLLSGMFLCIYIFMKLETSEGEVKTPRIGQQNVPWNNIFEVVISKKSTISGYVFQTVSFTNSSNEKDYFIAGSWLANSESLIEELKQKAVNAKIIDQRA